MTPLIIIPARAGSKGVPGKNVRRVEGQSLLERAIDIARQLGEIVVTSDDPEACRQTRQAGVRWHPRPSHLATDGASMCGVIADVIGDSTRTRIWILLQPTTPTRPLVCIIHAFERWWTSDRTRTLATMDPPISAHGLVWVDDGDTVYESVTRQKAPLLARLNGAAYIGCGPMTPTFLLHETPPQLNIDTPEDWARWVVLRQQEIRDGSSLTQPVSHHGAERLGTAV